MKKSGVLSATIALIILFPLQARSRETTRLSANHSSAGLQLSWPATVQKADGSVVWPYFELQRTVDLQRWEPIGERRRAFTTTPGQSLNAALSLDDSHAFYRLLSIEPIMGAKLGSGGAEVFGYGDAFAQALQGIGQISPDQFAAMFPNRVDYLPGISWDPTTAQFWDQFNAEIQTVNQGKTEGDPGCRTVSSARVRCSVTTSSRSSAPRAVFQMRNGGGLALKEIIRLASSRKIFHQTHRQAGSRA